MKRNNEFIQFIGIGAPKSGTTWISQCIAAGPEISFSITKEINYFSEKGGIYEPIERNYLNGIDWFKDFFLSDDKIRGEFSTSYLSDVDAARKIKKVFPTIKIIVSLREPVARTFSDFIMQKYAFKLEPENTFEQAINSQPEYIERSLYYECLKRYYDIFDSENIHVIIFDDIISEPENVIRNLYKFLGINVNFNPNILKKRINEGIIARSMILTKILDITRFLRKNNYHKFIMFMYKIGIYHSLQKIYNIVNGSKRTKPTIRYESAKELSGFFTDDINNLEKLIKRDLSTWKNQYK